MHQTATHHAVLALTPFASPRATGYQPNLLNRIGDPFRNSTRREGPAIVLKDGSSDCRYHIEAAKPDAAPVPYAASLSIKEGGADELGIQFTEKATSRCE
ncbi:MAG: hypothetical protein QNJ87_12610 [Gammaproteobacteria bacterium]|nr:hypothetical protein [Gammaproteobacteria bacterium]MDJ0891449.1 hypothetical protein [Gammaproteobacteria bacterium]